MQETERIREMEAILDRLAAAKSDLSKALSAFGELLGDLKTLSDYYGSRAYFHDLEMDEKGMLPADLKRGVLSEDTVYDLLGEIREIAEEMNQMSERTIESMKK